MRTIIILLILFPVICFSQKAPRAVVMDKNGYPYIMPDSLHKVAGSGNYNDLNNKPTITPNSAGTGISIVGGAINNTSPDQVVTITPGVGISVTGTYPNFTIAAIQPTITHPVRTVNSNFTISTTKAAFVSYSILCQVTNPLLAGSSTATVILQYSLNGGSSWQDAVQIGNSSTVGVAVAIAITNGQTAPLAGFVPANALVRINSATTGTATVSVSKTEEVIY